MTKEAILILFALTCSNCFFARNFDDNVKYFKDKHNHQIIATKLLEPKNNPEIDNIIYFREGNRTFKRIYNYLTPEMFGAKGDGVSDDYKPIQDMLDKGDSGCIFMFNGKKTYYNAFRNDGKWVEPKKRNMWVREKSATFLFNGAKLRRRMPQWNDKNNKDDYNFGKFYTDDHTAILYLSGNNFVLDGADFNSNIPLGTLLDEDGKVTKIIDYAVGSCLDMGLWIENSKNVTVKNSTFSNSVFPVFIENSENLIFENNNIRYAAQANKRIHSKDQALGGGIKLIRCKNAKLLNLNGYKNLNDTVEIESLNSNVTVTGKSEDDYANSVVIISSENIALDWYSKNIVHGTGVLIRSSIPNDVAVRNITGKIKIDGASWCGVMIWLDKSATNNIDDIKLKIVTDNTGYTGLLINNENLTKKITNLQIDHNSANDGISSGTARIFNNTMEGTVTGFHSNISKYAAKTTGINRSKSYFSLNIKSKDPKNLKYNIAKESKILIK